MARSERILLSVLAALSLVLRALAFFRYRFDSDEPQHLHVAWGWTAGLVQYRDLFDNHAPLFHILTAPILALFGERPDILLYMRAVMLPLFAIVLYATFYVARRLYSTRVALWSTLLLSLFPPFFLKSVEYRTDNLWNTVWAVVLIVILAGEMTVARSLVVGLLLGIALCVSLKTILLVITLLLAAVTTLAMTGRFRPVSRFLPRVLAGAAGFLV
ncbi:MAG: glycosyltransferase family 39 protein, partial [Acidobacteriota bacterium]